MKISTALNQLQAIISKQKDESKTPLTFTAVENNSSIKLSKVGTPDDISLQYKLNDSNWTDYTIDQVITLQNVGDKVQFKGSTTTFSKDLNNYYKFVMTGIINGSENINSLINYSNLTDYCYNSIFEECISLITTPILPSTNLAKHCYRYMFYKCTSLTVAPQLSATTLSALCYTGMFKNCTSLTTAPQLPATNLASECYNGMFGGCTSLTTAPQLHATTLVNSCYRGMFKNCTSLTTAPQLSATNLSTYCYSEMFIGCTSLTTAPDLPATTLVQRCYEGLFQGCTSLTTAPQLPATTLVSGCYVNMFTNCTSLNKININFRQWPLKNLTNSWLQNVSPTGTFIKPSSLPQKFGTSYIPNNWTVINK